MPLTSIVSREVDLSLGPRFRKIGFQVNELKTQKDVQFDYDVRTFIKSVLCCGEKGMLVQFMGMKICAATVGNSLEVPQNLKTARVYDPAVSCLGIFTRK